MQDYKVQQAQVYTDFNGLNALKAQARTDKESALREVARQFESLFLSEMLKSMRKAGDVFSEGNYLNSNQSELYRDMFDSQMSLTMAGGKGSGLAEALVRQLSKQIPGMDNEGGKLAGHKASLADYDRSLPALTPQLADSVQQVTAVAEKAVSPVSATPSDLPERFESPEHFVTELLPMAERVARDSGIDPKLMVAQAALETGCLRLRPVLLTAITTVLGLMPMVLGVNVDLITPSLGLGAPSTQWWTQLSSAIAGGLAFATVLTLLLTPSLLVLGNRAGEAFGRLTSRYRSV